MPDKFINREAVNVNVAFASGATDSSAVRVDQYAFGNLYLPAEFTADTISFKGCDTETGTYALIYDDTGVLVSFAAGAVGWFQVHPAVLAMPFVKVITNTATAGTATAILALKS